MLTTRIDLSSSGVSTWPAALVVWGPGRRWTSHAHHSVKVLVALDGTLRVRTHRPDGWRSCGAVVVPADVKHEIDALGSQVLILFLDPESESTASLLKRIGSKTTPVPDDVVADWRQALGNGRQIDSGRVDAWVRKEFSSVSRPRRLHAGVRRVLEYLRGDNLDRDQTSLNTLADVARLSPSRLMHVFTESVGIPLRPYILWLRVQRAACALNTGHTPTEAALLAGFSDAPHLVRTLRRTLGTTPGKLLSRVPIATDVHV